MISLLYCPACDLTAAPTVTGTCVQCGGAVMGLTPFVQASEKRAFDKVRDWAIEQRDMCREMQKFPTVDSDSRLLTAAWSGSETSLNALLEWLDNCMNSEAQS